MYGGKTAEVIIIIIMITIILIYFKTIKYEVTYVKSDIDNNKYLVRDIKDKERAANMLARIKLNILTLNNYLVQNKDKYHNFNIYITRLNDRIHYTLFNESTPDSVYTSYSVNKGDQLVFCLRSKKKKDQIHDLNLLMYVALHEIAHIACPEEGHTELFKQIFAFFAQIAIQLGLYQKMPFDEKPEEYCGLIIYESII